MPRILCAASAVLALAGSAAAQTAVRTVPVNAGDVVYSPLTGRLYASVNATPPATSVLVEIDPLTGAITGEIFGQGFPIFDQPTRMTISEAGDVLYVSVSGGTRLTPVRIAYGITVGPAFVLGTPDPTLGARTAEDFAILPGNTNVVVAARRFASATPRHAGVAAYDTGVERATVTADGIGSNAIAFGAIPGRLYGYNNETAEFGFRRMDVTASGVTILESTTGLIDGFGVDIEYGGGRIYATSGRVIDPEARTIVTTLAGLSAPGTLVEPTADAIYYLTQTGADWRLRSYDPSTFAGIIDAVVPGVTGTPRSLVAAGPDMLAFVSGGHVFLVRPSLFPTTDPTITITGPTTSGALTAEVSSITLTGTSVGAIAGIAWSTDRGYTGTANGTTEWTAGDIPLLLGANAITVTATNDAGQTSTDVVTVTVPAFTAFLAEGSTGTFFDYDLALANPSPASVVADISYFTQAGTTITQSVTLPAQSRRTIKVDEVPGLEANFMSTTVRTTTAPIVVERTMRWGATPEARYGAHGDKATAGPALKWYFAEGAQGEGASAFFTTFLLLANTGSTVNTATIDWLTDRGPVQRRLTLPAQSRTTIAPRSDPNVSGTSFGIVVTFATPAVAERAMYFGLQPDQFLRGGHDSAGATAPSTRWFLAEGASGPFFETFVLLANPHETAVDATLRFLTGTGVSVTRTVSVPARSRLTVDPEGLSPAAPELANVPLATIVTATRPIVAERAQYWPGLGDQWYEAHNSFGVTAARPKWGLAEGRVGNPAAMPPANYQTYVLLANPGTTAATVTMRFLREAGAPVIKTFTVAGERRVNVAVAGPGSSVPELADEMFGVEIESTQPIVVERALYGDAGTQVFGIGTNATATPLP
jgi:hypothetical protein